MPLNYYAYYGLSVEPFRLTPDPKFLNFSETHQSALKVLLEGILGRKGLLLLTGPIGTGKTTILHATLQMLTDAINQDVPIRSALLFNPKLSPSEFVELMLDDLRVPCLSTSKATRLVALHKMLIDMQHQGGTTVLFVDEAHLLSTELLEEIRLLGNADTHEEKMLQIVLSGQPDLASIMNRKDLQALQQRIAVRAHLRHLTDHEVRVYIAERLHFAGLQGESPLPANTVDKIFRYSGGVPRLINLICDNCLALGFRMQQKTIAPTVVEEVAVSIGLAQRSSKKTTLEAVSPSDLLPKQLADTLIEAMKQARSARLESHNIEEERQ